MHVSIVILKDNSEACLKHEPMWKSGIIRIVLRLVQKRGDVDESCGFRFYTKNQF